MKTQRTLSTASLRIIKEPSQPWGKNIMWTQDRDVVPLRMHIRTLIGLSSVGIAHP